MHLFCPMILLIVPCALLCLSIQPTDSPTSEPSQASSISVPLVSAAYAADMTAPMCAETSSGCVSGLSLLKGSGANTEPNQGLNRNSNTIDDCQDGTQSTYGTDESIEWLNVLSVDPDTDEYWDRPLRVGGRARIVASLHTYLVNSDDPSNDYADLYYSTTLDPPNWVRLQTINPQRGEVDPDGFGTFESDSFSILEGTDQHQAIRVNLRYQGSQSSCTGGSWADTDDLVFHVKPGVPATVPPSPSHSKQPTSFSTNPPSSAKVSRYLATHHFFISFSTFIATLSQLACQPTSPPTTRQPANLPVCHLRVHLCSLQAHRV